MSSLHLCNLNLLCTYLLEKREGRREAQQLRKDIWELLLGSPEDIVQTQKYWCYIIYKHKSRQNIRNLDGLDDIQSLC